MNPLVSALPRLGSAALRYALAVTSVAVAGLVAGAPGRQLIADPLERLIDNVTLQHAAVERIHRVVSPLARPSRVADGASLPLNPGDLWRIEKTSISGALERCRHGVLRQSLQVREGDLSRARNHARNCDTEGVGVERFRTRDVLAHEKGIEWSQPRGEIFAGRLQRSPPS